MEQINQWTSFDFFRARADDVLVCMWHMLVNATSRVDGVNQRTMSRFLRLSLRGKRKKKRHYLYVWSVVATHSAEYKAIIRRYIT